MIHRHDPRGRSVCCVERRLWAREEAAVRASPFSLAGNDARWATELQSYGAEVRWGLRTFWR